MVGPGQQLGRALAELPNRLEAYTIDILGSIAGIVAVCGLFVVRAFAGVVVRIRPRRASCISCGRTIACAHGVALAAAAAAVLALAIVPRGSGPRELWSPYYRVGYQPDQALIDVNLIGHQQMQPLHAPFPAYALPHLLNRDAGGNPFADVLIIGAGSGNDVSRALAWGAERVDAVEIDPVIQRIGKARSSRSPL